ncbi:MAG: SulP family inorganic anion transporter [Planctomycetes bacterium]|nr:SulP family inorganic anion transporter [Planctomycetota bacterium]
MSEVRPGAPLSARPSLVADLKSGFLVFLIALPLCLGIAMASGFPPVAGVMTAMVGGLIVSPLGSAPLTIKGPAAGLIVIAIGAVTELGQGDMVAGYHRACAVGVVAAAFQVAFALLRLATVGIAISPSVVHGMLAAIGVIIVSKQTHVALGATPTATTPLGLVAEIPHSVVHANPEIATIGLLSLAVLFGWGFLRSKFAKAIPAPLVVLALAVPLGLWFDLPHAHAYEFWREKFEVGPQFLVRLPGSLLEVIALPDFSQILSGASIKYIVMFALVGTIESTLSCLAVDGLDPKKRASDLNRDLFALGVGNLVAAAIGGLPMISEIVRSKANIDAGAQSAKSNFLHGAFLLAFVVLAPGLLQSIPLAALAAMLVFTGTRLASPRHFVHSLHIGLDQLVLFTVTLLVTLATDLLVGVGVGLGVKLLLHFGHGAGWKQLFGTQVECVRTGDELRIALHGAAAFTSLLAVRKAVLAAPADVRRIVIDCGDVTMIDHTFLSRVDAMGAELPHATIELAGMDGLHRMSGHPHATRRRLA